MKNTILFDFFGTLVEYSASRSQQEFAETYAFVTRKLVGLEYDAFVQTWDRSFSYLEQQSRVHQLEFSMDDVVTEFSHRLGVQSPSKNTRDGLIDRFMHEWSAEIRPISQLELLLGRLAPDYRLGIVSNTHQTGFVPALLARFDIAAYFNTIVTSIDHGRPKPHESIYAAALNAIGAKAETTIFIGDTLEHDYLGPRRIGMHAILISSTTPPAVPRAHVVSDINNLIPLLPEII